MKLSANRKLPILILCGLFMACPAPAATIVFDTITPTGVTTGAAGVFVGTTGGLNYERAANFSFTGLDDVFLTEVQLLLSGPGNIVSIYSDAAGAPGALLDQAAAATPIVNLLYSAAFTGDVLLEADTVYWLTVSRATGSSAWRYTSNGPYQSGARMFRINGGAWADSSPRNGQLYGFSIAGDSATIPLPAALPLLISALGLTAFLRRR